MNDATSSFILKGVQSTPELRDAESMPSLSAFVAQLRGNGTKTTKGTRHRLLAAPTREDVFHGFRLILGREPEDESAVSAHLRIPTVAELRQVLLDSEEFKGKFGVMFPSASEHPNLSMSRETLVLIHLQKTGGTSLRDMLGQHFPKDRRCAVLENKLHFLSIAELSRYDFYSGHFDRASIRFIPRDDIKIVALFREPQARLVSFYRFLKAHPVADEFSGDTLIRLANECTPEEFFESPELRRYSAAFNHYLFAFGGSFVWFDNHRSSFSKDDLSRALEEAKLQIRALAALGITERFEESVRCICHSLHMMPPSTIARSHVTDNLPILDARFRRVAPVEMTPRLRAAMQDLTAYDEVLYRFAVKEFDRRCTESARLRPSLDSSALDTNGL